MNTNLKTKADTNEKHQLTKQIVMIIIDKWMPAILTGIIVAIFVPYFQIKFSAQSQLTKRKVELWESIGSNFTGYVESNFQLVYVAKRIKEAENNKITPSETLISQRSEFLKNRDQFANQLNKDIAVASFYYNEPMLSLYSKYSDWVGQIENSSIDNMPQKPEFYTWRDSMLLEMGKQLKIR